MIVIVTGGRDYNGTGLVEALDELRAAHPDFGLHVGDFKTGAESVARSWVTSRNMQAIHDAQSEGLRTCIVETPRLQWVIVFRQYEWYGKEAISRRNQLMVDEAVFLPRNAPFLCLVAGGDGDDYAQDLVHRCREAGFEIREVTT